MLRLLEGAFQTSSFTVHNRSVSKDTYLYVFCFPNVSIVSYNYCVTALRWIFVHGVESTLVPVSVRRASHLWNCVLVSSILHDDIIFNKVYITMHTSGTVNRFSTLSCNVIASPLSSPLPHTHTQTHTHTHITHSSFIIRRCGRWATSHSKGATAYRRRLPWEPEKYLWHLHGTPEVIHLVDHAVPCL